jgi:hypothetical protein
LDASETTDSKAKKTVIKSSSFMPWQLCKNYTGNSHLLNTTTTASYSENFVPH